MSYQIPSISEIISETNKILNPAKSNGVRIESYSVTQEQIDFWSFRPSSVVGLKPGEYRRLMVDYDVMMSNTPMEIKTNYDFMKLATGNVLIAGLGMGMLLSVICNKPSVKSVVVVEKNEDVINCTWPQIKDLPNFNKVHLIHEDIFNIKSVRKSYLEKEIKDIDGFRILSFNTMYFDIWPGINEDYYNEAQKLKEMYLPILHMGNRKNQMDWISDYYKYNGA